MRAGIETMKILSQPGQVGARARGRVRVRVRRLSSACSERTRSTACSG